MTPNPSSPQPNLFPQKQTALKLALGLVLGATFGCFAQPTLAQTQHNSTSTGFQDNEANFFDGSEQGSFNPLDIFHGVNLGSKTTPGEFRQNTRRSLDNSAAEFRRQQLERIRQQQQQNSPTPPTPES